MGAKFNPKPGTRDIKRLFMGFLKSMSTPMPGGGFGGEGFGGKGSPSLATWRPLGGSPAQVGPGGGFKRPMFEVAPPGPVGGSDIFTFADHWGLDEEAVEGPGSMPEEVQLDIMATFAPRDTTRDVKNLFMSFLKSRSSGPGVKRSRLDML